MTGEAASDSGWSMTGFMIGIFFLCLSNHNLVGVAG
jgi:hypothetical protein